MKKCVKCGNTYDAKNFGLAKDDAEKLRSGYYFFNFPKLGKLRYEWAKKLDLPKTLKLTPRDVVCSAHFPYDDARKMAKAPKPKKHTAENLVEIESSRTSEINEEEGTSEIVVEAPTKAKDSAETVINGVALFLCGACPALFAHRSALDDHIAMRGSSWNSSTHSQHFKGIVKACRKVARDPTSYNVIMEQGVPSIKRLRPVDHSYSNSKKSRRSESPDSDDEDEDEDSCSLPEKLFPDLVVKPSYRRVGVQKPLAQVRSTIKGAQRRRELDFVLWQLNEKAIEKETLGGVRLAAKKNGFLKVLKDGRVMRERSFIT